MNEIAARLPQPPPIAAERRLSAAEWGMIAFLVSEAAFFSTLVVTYVAFVGQDVVGPTPREALSLPLVIGTTICLVASSMTIHAAEQSLAAVNQGRFRMLLGVTIALGLAFLAGTAYEWHELIEVHQLTIGRNLFGTTYYTVVGFHALHVTMGVLAMLVVLAISLRGALAQRQHVGVKLVGWYWHFVDGVWIAVFLVVYVGGELGGP